MASPPPANWRRCRSALSTTVPLSASGVASHHDLNEVGHPVAGQFGPERTHRPRGQLCVPAVHRRLLGLVPPDRGGRARFAPPGPARRVGPGLAQRSQQRVGAPTQPGQEVAVAGRGRQLGPRALRPRRPRARWRPSTTAPRRCGGPGRAPTIRGRRGPGRPRSADATTSLSRRLSSAMASTASSNPKLTAP